MLPFIAFVKITIFYLNYFCSFFGGRIQSLFYSWFNQAKFFELDTGTDALNLKCLVKNVGKLLDLKN